jgi:hypothetical protein
MTDLNSYEESLANDLAKAEALIEELVKERDDLGRKLNTARYGQPDFAWSIHEEAMADLRAKLAKAVEALREIETDCDADYPPSHGAIKHFAIATLAEIKGGNDAESNL